MTDRELLMYAARAIGRRIVGWNEQHGGEPVAVLEDSMFWQPLHFNVITDCMGDALRLAVALRINIEHAETLSRKPHGVNCWPVGRGDCGYMENNLTDYAAATRRAIVRAAAEIGKHGKA
jgi:hypothetical protein